MADKENRNFVSDYRVIVSSEPKVNTIQPKSGEMAGKNVDVLNVDVYKQHAEKQQDGSWKKLANEFFKLELYSAAAKSIAPMLVAGLALRVAGEIKEHEYQGKDGTTKVAKSLVANSIGIDLLQKGLNSIDFTKPERQQQQTQNKNEPAKLQDAPAKIKASEPER